MSEHRGIAGLVLAAGESTRMGRDKALLAYRGRNFLETIVATLREAGIERVVVVLGHHAEEIRRASDLRGTEIVVNPNYSLGQTSSLQAGIKALGDARLEAIMLCLVDHPAVKPETVRRLVEVFEKTPAPVVIPTFQNRRGHPVVIARALFKELLSLGTQEGANTVIRKYQGATRFVEVEDHSVLVDVDDQESYRKLESAGK
jgi:molybdenum cofactor cytidylyltransferase